MKMCTKDMMKIKVRIQDKKSKVLLNYWVVLAMVLTLQLSTALALDADGIKKRVISLSPIITETIYMLEGQDQLIANTTYCNVPEQAMLKEKIGSVIQMNVEKIITLHPDLVIASALSSEKQLGILKKQSVPILKARNPQTFEQMCDTTMSIGQILGKQEKARQVVDLAKKQVDMILGQTKGLPRKKVFIQIGMKPLHTANKDTFINEYIQFGGGINIAENSKSGIYSREKVVRENPDIILIATMGTSKKAGETERQRWMTFPFIAAVAANNVHVLDSEIIFSPTPITFVHGLKTIASLIHPEIKNHFDIMSHSKTQLHSEIKTEL